MNKKFYISILHLEDVDKLCNLIYSNFGQSYPDKEFYDSTILRKVIQKGSLIPIVVKYKDKLVGHLALRKRKLQNIYYAGSAVVDRQYRGKGLLTKLMSFALSYLKKKDIWGFYGEPITSNNFSQRASKLVGGKEVGVFLRRVLPVVKFVESPKKKWGNTVIFFYSAYSLSNCSFQIISSLYDNIIEEIFYNLEIKHIKFRKEGYLGNKNNYTVRIEKNWKIGELLVENLTTIDDIFWEKKIKFLNNYAHSAVYLNLSHCFLNEWINILKSNKYFFAGIIPLFFKTGSALVMQRIQQFDFITKNYFVTNFGERLYYWCIKDGKNFIT